MFDESAISIVNIYRCPANTPATQKYRISIVYVLVPCPHPKPCQAPEPYPAMNPPITVTVTTTQLGDAEYPWSGRLPPSARGREHHRASPSDRTLD